MAGGFLRIRLAAPPIEGRANRELCRFLAERLHVRPSDITVTAGTSGRRKRVLVAGLTVDEVQTRLDQP